MLCQIHLLLAVQMLRNILMLKYFIIFLSLKQIHYNRFVTVTNYIYKKACSVSWDFSIPPLHCSWMCSTLVCSVTNIFVPLFTIWYLTQRFSDVNIPVFYHFFEGMYVLCVHDSDPGRGECIKHYKIRRLDNGGCYITSRSVFATHAELIRHYQSK